MVACLVVGLGLATTGTAGAAPTDTPSHPPAVSEPAGVTSPGVAPSGVAPAAERLAHVWANNVNVRYCPLFTCGVRAQVDRGWYPYICTMAGDRVTYGQYTNIYWTRIAVDTDGNGYYETPGWVSDVFVSGGGNDQPAMQPTDWICGA